MATKRCFSEEDFTCPVCCDVFKEPVLLSCGHSACSKCVNRYWATKGCRECPLCRKRSTRKPTINLALKNLCQTFVEIRGDPESLCDIHGVKLKLFCVNDGQAACLMCRDSDKHLQHRFIPVDEAAAQFKHALMLDMNTLNLKTKSLEDVLFLCHQNVDHVKQQGEYIKSRINGEILELVQFLMQENVAMVSKVEEEVREKLQMLENKTENIKQKGEAISRAIQVIKKDLQSEDVKFLKHNYMKYMTKTQDKESNPTLTSGATNVAKKLDPTIVSKEVIDVAKYLGNLQFRIWNKMQKIIKYTPVVLDPNTAHTQLILSEDLTSMRDSDDHEDKANKPRPPVLDTPERFRSLCVLGSEGFSSGLHCWDVEVGNSTFWMLGVTTRTVQRKEPSVVPSGAWGIRYDGEKLCARAPTEAYTPLPLVAKPQIVRIRLDMDSGEVWFLDPESKAVIHMFSHHFTEKVFPLFHSMCSLFPLKIRPLQSFVILRNIP